MPLFASGHGVPPTPDEVRQVAAYVATHRVAGGPFDVVVGGSTTPQLAADVVVPLVEAGATWWDERGLYESPDLHSLGPVLRRVEAGPPRP
ncbi:hypothetical protein [Promicromonospora sp. NPDC023987]|uniref:hypothetical protein n=1 Tax=Promicromonospora sp. NPDC023987 TaxID=3155360 RepID=UPI0033ECB4E7